MRWWRLCAVLAMTASVTAGVAGCSAGYYLQAARGQVALLRARVPLERYMADPHTSAETRRQLLVADDALLYARLQLALPASRSYHAYVDLERPAVVWNVFAAPGFSLEPRQWCYPIAGCATYRGWFSEQKARRYAERLALQGNDVFVGGVSAYSTLGWFADPILSTMLDGSDASLAGILFHELAHEQIFVAGDTRFNEGFATFIQIEGTERWLTARGRIADLCAFRLGQQRQSRALAILSRLREELRPIYASPDLTTAERLDARHRAFDAARARYAGLRAGWPAPPYFDGWFDARLNNARLAALASYADAVPAFRGLLAQNHGDLIPFYAGVRQLAGMAPGLRAQRLAALATDAPVNESGAEDSGCRAGY